MANRKHLINVHTSTGTQAPTGASLYLGEIAVQHTPNEPAIWIKMGSADTSTEYEKFIGETEILSLLEETKILGSGYTYSGLSYIDSSTTIADAFSALTNELIKDEKVTAAAINELNVKTNEINSIKQIIREDEEVTAGAINQLNERVAGVETHMTGDYIQITGYELASGSTEEELTLREEDTVDEAFGKLQKQMLDNEEAIAAGLNDLNNKVEDLEEQIEHSTGVTQLSGAVMTLSAATVAGFEEVSDELSDKANSSDLEALSAGTIHDIAAVSAKTAGILTLNLNGVEQGQYCPSASTVINLEAIQEITGADVLLTGYELASGSTEEELVVLASDTVNEAFGKLQKQNYDNEAVVAGALNDLDERVTALEEGGSVTELSAATVALSAATVTLSSSTNADIQAISADTIALSAATVALSAASEDFFNGAEYISSAKTIVFKNGEVEKASIDATDFIKDGMVSAVTVSGGSMIISFNTDAGREDIELELTDIFDPDNYYTKDDINDGVSASTLELSAATIEVESCLTVLSGVVIDTSYVIAQSLNDLNGRVDALSGNTGLSELSAATVSIDGRLTGLSAATVAIEGDVTELSAATVAIEGDVTELSAATIEVESGLTILSGVTEEISDNLETLSGVVIDNELVTAEALISLNSKIDELSGNSGFDGFEEVTWSALKTLRDSSGLTPGKQYRITDYNTTTSQEDTQAAGHQFDIIVVADSVNKLNENARAALHSGDTYFSTSGANLNAWEIKYSLDNDDKRFYWAVTGSTGRGVIYYMKDEWNNECPYDFKNIQFKRKLTDGVYDTGGVETFVYTFNAYDSDNETINDASIMVGRDALDDGTQYCFSNIIKPYFRIYMGNTDGFFMLNDNVFLNLFSVSDGAYFECFYNTFGNNCVSNTFGDGCYSNTFGNNFVSNTFGNGCNSNTFGYGCGRNTFEYGCGGNTFGNSCNHNTFGYGCGGNTFGDGCDSNTFGNSCNHNTFGNGCNSNTFKTGCFFNIFGNCCMTNSFSGDCNSNTFGNNCLSNTFGNSSYYNSFGNHCQQIIFNKDYVQNVIIENGNQYITLTSTQTPTNALPLRNITIAQGVNNSTTRKTISHNTLNDTFNTTYQSGNSQIINI